MLVNKEKINLIPLFLVILICIVMIFVVYYHAFGQLWSFNLSWGEDQAQFHQVFWNLVNRGNLACSIYTTSCFFSGKFMPIIFFLAPIYWLHQDISTLLFIAAVALCFTGVVVYLIAQQLTRNNWVALLMALFYYLYYPVTNLMTIGFRGAIIAMPFFALAVLFYLKKQFWPMLVALILAAFCREDVPLILVGFSLLAWFEGREKHWRFVPGLLGLGYFFVIYMYIMPWLNNLPLSDGVLFRPGVGVVPMVGGPGFSSYGHFGGTPLEIMKNMFLRIDVVVGVLTRSHIKLFLNNLLSSMFFLPIFSPLLYVPVSQFLILFLSDRTYYASTGTYYFAPLVPFIFAALADTLRRIKQWRIWKLVRVTGDWVIIILLLMMLWGSRGNLVKIWCNPRINQANYQALSPMLAKIPQKASVMTQLALLPNLSARAKIHVLAEYPQTDYVVLFLGGNLWPLNSGSYNTIVKRMLISGDYGLFDRQQRIVVLKRNHETQNNAELFVELFPGYTRDKFYRIIKVYQERLDSIAWLDQSGTNLLSNGGFEQVIDNQPAGWQLAVWQKDECKCFYLVDSPGVGGSGYAAKIVQQALADSRWTQAVTVKSDTYYKLSGFIKTEVVKNMGDGAYLEIADLGVRSKQILGNKDWREVEVVFKTEQQSKITVVCRLGGYASPNIGTAYFDNIVLQETVSLDEVL